MLGPLRSLCSGILEVHISRRQAQQVREAIPSGLAWPGLAAPLPFPGWDVATIQASCWGLLRMSGERSAVGRKKGPHDRLLPIWAAHDLGS